FPPEFFFFPRAEVLLSLYPLSIKYQRRNRAVPRRIHFSSFGVSRNQKPLFHWELQSPHPGWHLEPMLSKLPLQDKIYLKRICRFWKSIARPPLHKLRAPCNHPISLQRSNPHRQKEHRLVLRA